MVASGTTDPLIWQQCIDAIDYLIRRGRDDLIDDLFERLRDPLEIRSIHRGGLDGSIEYVASTTPIDDALASWIKIARHRNGKKLSPATIKGYQNSINQLIKHLYHADTVRDLPDVLERVRNHYIDPPDRDQPQQAANVKRMLLAFARATEGPRSDLHAMISGVAVGVYTPKIPPHLSMADAAFIRDQLPPLASAIWWAGCMTGFRYPSELAKTPWTCDKKSVTLAGDHLGEGKVVPCLDPNIEYPKMSDTRFRVHFKRVALRLKLAITPYHSRRIFQQFITLCGLDRYRMRQYLGRSEDAAMMQGYSTSDSHYQRHAITPELIESDRARLAKALRKILAAPSTLASRMESGNASVE